jgi:CheY-like chemotaxis protein
VRQALLSVLTTAIRLVPGGTLGVSLSIAEAEVVVGISAVAGATVETMGEEDHNRLTMAQRLVEISQGTLETSYDPSGPRAFHAALCFPAADRTPVFFVEDNEDTLMLLERHVENTRYRFIGSTAPEQAVAVAAETRPSVVVLDVMLPGVDGWELLGRLQQHPATADLPVIVCSILPQAQLAASLGAAGFIAKPVSRAALLEALDRQLAQLPRESL